MKSSKAAVSLRDLNRKKGALDALARRYDILSQDLNRDMRTLKALGKSKNENLAPAVRNFYKSEAKKYLNHANRTVKEIKAVTEKHARLSARLNFLTKRAAINLARNLL